MTTTPKYGSAADVAKHIREWLGKHARENTASLLLYEAMQALEGKAGAQVDAKPVAWSADWIRDQIADTIETWPLAKMTVWQMADQVRQIKITAPSTAPGLSDEQIQALAHRICSKYTHAEDADLRQYEFGKLTLTQFAHAIESALSAQADAQPVAWQVHPFDYGIGSEGVYARTDRPEQVEAWKRKGWEVQALFTHPAEASAAVCVKCGDAILAHDPGTCGSCHAMGTEASAPGLSNDVLNQLIELGTEARAAHHKSQSDDGHAGTAAWERWHELREQMRAILTRVSAAQEVADK